MQKRDHAVADFFTQTARLVPYSKRPRAATGYVTAFADEPRPDDPAYGLGNFYAVLEVISGGREAEEVVQLTLQTAEEAYYSEGGPAEILDRFEAATKAVNRALTDYVNRGNAGWVGKMSGALAVLDGQDLHVAYTGSAEAFLYRGPHATRIAVQPHNRIQQPSKIFGSIASGSMEIGDKLLLATPALVHHLALNNLKTIIGENSPSGAVAKITTQLEGHGSDRVAALILELSTPELTAQAMPAQLPSPVATPSLAAAARSNAAPILGEAAERSAQIANRARQAARESLPVLREAGWKTAGLLRPVLQNKRGRIAVAGAAAVIIVAGIWGAIGHHSSVSKSDASQQISQLIVAANADQDKVINQDESVRPDLVRLQAELAKLNTKANQSAWKSAGTDPATLAAQIQSDLDQLDHVVAVQPQKVADLGQSKPSLMALAGSQLVTVSGNTITTVNLKSGSSRQSTARLTGKVTAITSAGDSVYLLTDQPGVWQYSPTSDSLVQTSSGWAKGSALSSYSGNLYELTSSQGVIKRLPTLTGFSAPTSSIPASAQGVSGSTSLAVDGAIYLGSPAGIYRYVAGSLTGHINLPVGLKSITSLVPANGDYFLAIDLTGSRVAVITNQNNSMTVSAVYAVPHLSAATVDPASGKIYAASGNQLVSYSLPR